MKWFGESWGAPVCEPSDHVAAPVGMVCQGHDHLHHLPGRSAVIEPDDQGVMIPYYGHGEQLAWHLDCWLHEIGADRSFPNRSAPTTAPKGNPEVGGPGWSIADLD